MTIVRCQDLRRTLGQFPTGVAVITARAADGRKVGVTVNSFASLSLDPPMVLFCLGKHVTSHADVMLVEHFGINVLAADQHQLARQFATPLPNKFAGVPLVSDGMGAPDAPESSTGDLPLLDGVVARLVCHNVEQHDGGDHTIFVGEVLEHQRFAGEPLVFHSGSYRVAAHHPDFGGNPVDAHG